MHAGMKLSGWHLCQLATASGFKCSPGNASIANELMDFDSKSMYVGNVDLNKRFRVRLGFLDNFEQKFID